MYHPRAPVVRFLVRAAVPRHLDWLICRPLILPVHPLQLVPLLGCISPISVDGYVQLQDDGAVDRPVDGCNSGHVVVADAFPLRADLV